ncbi:MAG: hypothetical protein KAS29_17115, partial [Bacteroidales bacterium]|nr:hypothetical protein [Bacteroidales bacterium]
MRVKILAVATTFFIGFSLLLPGALLNGQDNLHQETPQEHPEEVSPTHETDHSEVAHEEEFNATKYILEHVSDSHDWHILTTKQGHHVSVPLLVILYSKHS